MRFALQGALFSLRRVVIVRGSFSVPWVSPITSISTLGTPGTFQLLFTRSNSERPSAPGTKY
eukprot:2284619-Rhodomonas_salina.1